MSYQEYPRVLYGPLWVEDTKIVNMDEEKSAALAEGYALLPPSQEPASPGESPAPTVEEPKLKRRK